MSKKLTRRMLLKSTAAAAAMTATGGLLAACGGAPVAPAPTSAPAATTAPQATQAPAGEATKAPAAGGALKDVPRNRTLIHTGVGGEAPNQFSDVDLMNPYLPGISRSGEQWVFEPLFYYNVYGDKDNETKWIGESYEYNADFTSVTIKIRKGVEWSDGQPFTANDVAFTINMLKDNSPDLAWSTEMKQWVKQVTVTDDQTVKIDLTASNPRFVYRYFAMKFDIGIFIMPEHVFKGQDAKSFKFYDQAKGWPVTTAPYKLVLSSPEQKIWDRMDSWWAVKTGLRKELPAPERIIYTPGADESKFIQLLLANEVDTSLGMTAKNIKAVLDQNPKVDTWSGTEPPYGYVDWWPMGLAVNCMQPPYDDPNVRWAICRAINRDQAMQVAYGGAGVKTLVPWPSFPALQKYTDAIKDIIDQYQPDKTDPKETETLMGKAGWTKGGDGIFAKDGKKFSMVVETFNVFQDITPVIVEQLRRAGFDASFKMTADFFTRLPLGQVDAWTFGHGGGTRDPYDTLQLYHSSNVKKTGEASPQFYRWINKEYDALVEGMSVLNSDDPKFLDNFKKAMAIWFKELPDIMITNLIHRNPRNNTYWTNWPSKQNPYINDANWHRSWGLVLMNIKPTQ